MKHKWIVIFSLVVVLLVAGFGIKRYADYKHAHEEETHEYQKQEILGAEKAIVKDLEQYSDVKKIKFDSWHRDQESGSVIIAVKVNDKYLFGYNVAKNKDGSYWVGAFGGDGNVPHKKFRMGENKYKVKVIYTTREDK